MKTALCQLDIAWEDKGKNRIKVERFVSDAVDNNADLILFPEMTLTGFSMQIQKTAEQDRETIDFFKSLALSYNLNIGFGWVEAYKDKARNHYTVVSPKGSILSDFVKIHPFSYGDEDQFFVAGDKLTYFNLGVFGISTFICYDLRFPEVFQAVSGKVELIVVAANWPELRKEHWRALLKARAIENQVFIAGINCVGDKGGLKYSGNSMLVDPEGNIIDELTGTEGMILAEIDKTCVTAYREKFPLKKDRKTDFYKTIL